MKKLLTTALLAAAVAAPLSAQPIVVPPSAFGDEVGPFGQDPALGFAFASVGQTFTPLAGYLQSFAFRLRDDAGTGAGLIYRAYVADFTGGVLGAVLYESGNRVGTSVATTGGAQYTFPAPNGPLNLALDPARTYVAYLSIAATSGLFATGTNALQLADGDAYAGGDLALDLGAGLEAAAGLDAAFEADFSHVAAVPEPATFALVGGGLALVGAFARRRRAATS